MSVGVQKYLGAVDSVLGGAERLYPTSTSQKTLSTLEPVIPRPPNGAGNLLTYSSADGRSYQIKLTSTGNTDKGVNWWTSTTDEKGAGDRRDAAGIRTDARSTGNALAPAANSPEGMKTLAGSMEQRLAAMERKLATSKRQNALLAARLRQIAAAYRAAGKTGGGIPNLGSMGGSPSGKPSIPGAPKMNGIPGLSTLFGNRGTTKTRSGESAIPSLSSGALSASSSPKEVARAILAEAARRGYSRERAIAILSTAMQESGLRQQARGGGGAWWGIFQQDTSYHGRANPNLNIYEFFERLDGKGGRTSSDIWKSIFWLQQRPGESSAEAAYANGRKAYLREIQSQVSAATRMYDSIVG
ncbi:hypothetical protein [Mycolicibacterium brumae]|uniref:Phage tail lysozyme domain-containing protein n=1 Tax=Mycolicibacterium brumae TaxID=85968 RepID=A0A2G5P484_9MYCO|nr:hypothetical protein [Mycolicibacterium brumae]MCV7191375.1 hypothetical protein [Mycolicibacterium brumae]PIB73106.1 hypothetical protein CQY22_018215 [Mycolicibacterium brumae]RWA17030.1 hypothetical protein MBRU_18840 [Mycolicibacterium brumae DSM 44177]UWW08170.1 hypothetical protein L2Z93_001213 [Mycolicibacterium brumae]